MLSDGVGNPDRRSDLFGGTGQVLVWDLMNGSPAPPFTAILACELEAGGSVGAHVQHEFPEIVICTEGHGKAVVNDVEHSLFKGVCVHLPLGQTLALRNGSATAPLRYLIIKAAAENAG